MGRNSIDYNLFTNKAANGTSTKKIYASDFRHIGVQLATSNTAFTGTIKIKGTRVENGEDIDFTAASSQSNPWSYLQIIDNDNGDILAGSTGYALTASSDEIVNCAVNVDSFTYITAELSGYSGSGNITVDLHLNTNT